MTDLTKLNINYQRPKGAKGSLGFFLPVGIRDGDGKIHGLENLSPHFAGGGHEDVLEGNLVVCLQCREILAKIVDQDKAYIEILGYCSMKRLELGPSNLQAIGEFTRENVQRWLENKSRAEWEPMAADLLGDRMRRR